MKKAQSRNNWLLILIGAASVGLVSGTILLNGTDSPLYVLIRAFGILGYLGVFLASLSSAFLRELVRYFGRPFVKVHHVFAVSGLALLVLHAVAIAWDEASLGVFLPSFDSLTRFLELGGRPALWLLGVASLAALLRSSLRGSWRLVHRLNYVAYLLGTVHGALIGTDLSNTVARVILVCMAVGLTLVVGWKKTRQMLQRARSKKAQSS